MVEAPLGTCTGWNLRAREFGHGATHEFTGSYIPSNEDGTVGGEVEGRRTYD